MLHDVIGGVTRLIESLMSTLLRREDELGSRLDWHAAIILGTCSIMNLFVLSILVVKFFPASAATFSSYRLFGSPAWIGAYVVALLLWRRRTRVVLGRMNLDHHYASKVSQTSSTFAATYFLGSTLVMAASVLVFS